MGNVVGGKGGNIRADENGGCCPGLKLLHQRAVHAGAEVRPRLGGVLPSGTPLVTAKDSDINFRIGRVKGDDPMIDVNAFRPFQHVMHKRSVECRDLLGCIARLQARFNGAGDWIFDKDDEGFHGRRARGEFNFSLAD